MQVRNKSVFSTVFFKDYSIYLASQLAGAAAAAAAFFFFSSTFISPTTLLCSNVATIIEIAAA
jgi:hypothetical protein